MIKEAEPVPDNEVEEIIPEREYKQVQEELITEKMEKMTFESGADTSLVEAAAIASRELEVEETGNKTDQTGSAPAPSAAAAPSSGGQLEPALIHSDDDPSKEDEDKDDEILPTKEEETSTFPPQSPSSTTNPTFRPTFGSHEQPSFATSILANTT